MLRVSYLPYREPEIFHSIQGEGITAGIPTVFLRLTTCNLSCTWCDTKYTWDWENHDFMKETTSMSNQEVQERILAFDCPHLVITGGEPLLQQSELTPLVSSLAKHGLYCEVETNGTIVPRPEMTDVISQWNVSPKIDSSGNQSDRREVAKAIVAFRELNNAYFKFVIVEPSDIEEVCGLIKRYSLPADRVLLMPEGTTSQTIQKRGPWIAEACRQHGFRFSTRLHVLLWGDQRGR